MNEIIMTNTSALPEFILQETRTQDERVALREYLKEASDEAFTLFATELADQIQRSNHELSAHPKLHFKNHLIDHRVEFMKQAMSVTWNDEYTLCIEYDGVEKAATLWMPDAKQSGDELFWREFDPTRQLLDDQWLSKTQLASNCLKQLVELGLSIL